MAQKKLLVLAAVAVALLAAGLILKREPVRSLSQQAGLIAIFPPGFKAADIDKIVIEVPAEQKPEDPQPADKSADPSRARGGRLVLTRSEKGWILPDHFEAPAQDLPVDSLLSGLTGLTGEFRSDSKELFSDFGLEEGRAMVIRVFRKNRSDPSFSLLVGKSAGANTHFVREAGSQKVFSVAADLRTLAGASGQKMHQGPDFAKFADLTMLDFDPAEVRQVDLDTPLVQLALKKKETDDPEDQKKEAEWQVEPEQAFPLTPKGIQPMLSRLSNMKARDVAGRWSEGSDQDPFGFAKALLTARISVKGAPEKILTVVEKKTGTKEKEYLAHVFGNPLVFSVKTKDIEDLFYNQRNLFDLKLVSADRGMMNRISLNGSDGWTLIRDGKEWKAQGEETQKLEPNLVDGLTGELKKLTGTGLASKARVQGDRTLVIEFEKGDPLEIMIGDQTYPGPSLAARVGGIPATLLLPESATQKILVGKDDLFIKRQEQEKQPEPAKTGDM